MKKWLFFLAVSIVSISFALPIKDHSIDPEALSELRSAMGISEDADIIAETQKQWLRRGGEERWEMDELPREKREFVLQWAEKEHFFSAWKPALWSYDKALILGAATPRMEARLKYLKELWEMGVRFQEIVWLVGERPLNEGIDGFTKRCHNEAEAARLIWEEAELPEEMRALSLVFVTAPMQYEQGIIKRPNTEDTIMAWLALKTEPCRALFVSNQPFCGYQFATIKGCLPENFLFDLVGEGIDPKELSAPAAVTLDAIARWLYTRSTSNIPKHKTIQIH